MLEARQVINECYILQERIGKDSFCELWRATAIYTAAQLLLRFLDDRPALKALEGEFRSAALRCYRVADPAVADFVEIEHFGDRLFIASEFSGELPLSRALGPDSRFELEHICRFVMEMARGLDAFHGQGIPYGCLDAENVLMSRDAGVVRGIRIQKPGYFSVLGALEAGDLDSAMNIYGYLAPEVKAGARPDERSDVYSLGIHLVRFLTGELPLPRDARRIRDRSVSLEYVANALLRRSVPIPVVRVALRALRKEPARRYSACVDFMAELRVFMDERRRESLRSGRVDPLAELEALNLGFSRHGDAAQTVRTLDTADYFRALSDAPSEAARPRTSTGYPVRDFADQEEVRRIESREIEGAEDDGTLSIDEILDRSRRIVSRERGSRLLIPESSAAEERSPVPCGSGPKAVSSPISAPADSGTPAGNGRSEEVVPEPLSVEKAGPSGGTEGIHWNRVNLPPSRVAGELEAAFRKACRGRGTFRFIQDPRDGAMAGVFAEMFARFRYEGFFVDAGLLKPRSESTARMDVTDFIRAIRASIARALLGEPPGSVRYLRRRVAKEDSLGAFRAPPLDLVLFKAPGEEPDPDEAESPEGIRSIAESLLKFGRRNRPLVFVFRGGEWIDRPLHDLLLRFAEGASRAPVCGFVFYGSADVEDWHVLSRLQADSRASPSG